MSVRLKLMSHNVWECDDNTPDWATKGNDCSAQARVGGLLRVYEETQPDIIGCQEVSATMTDLLKEGFEKRCEKYTLIWGRYTPIIYKPDKLELVDADFGTYPESIDGYAGSFNNNRTKSWNLGVFRIKENGELLVFSTTHLWWKQSPDILHPNAPSRQAYSDEAREYQLASLLKKVAFFRKQYDCPAVVVGDMNTDYRSKAIQNALLCGFQHAHDVAVEHADESVGYHKCFGTGYEEVYSDAPFEQAIDHILVAGLPHGAVRRFERYSPDYYFPISDHSAAYIDIEL